MTWDDVTSAVRVVGRIFPQHLTTHVVMGCFPVGVLVLLVARKFGSDLTAVEACAVGACITLPIGWLSTRTSAGRVLHEKLVTLEAICERGNMTKTEKRAYFRRIAEDWMVEVRREGLRDAPLRLPQEQSDRGRA